MMARGSLLMAMDRVAAATAGGLAESVAATVNVLTTPGPVGVPVRAPLVALRVSPAARLPAVTAHVTGAMPPVDASVDPG
jgi:hypothetical protein